ncbi:MAG: isoprenylcysteine carboxylmethyltransferase family protein [Betaproteobacteria bacterium]|nr:isoprenylcysteine carboxylmethyltransferase family protein [Betaproteobacteria bacterium]MDE2622885.1 isoprenylcysteine carboxylmethyltransferase family protein [Betaproteobacteria bacterium]
MLARFWADVFYLWKLNPENPTLLALLASETLTIVLLFGSTKPASRDLHPLAVAASLGATFHFLALDLGSSHHLLPEAGCAVLMLTGLLWQVYAKLSLGRAFDLLPARRGTVAHGAYRLVRHPIYLGYLITHCGFLASHATLRNGAVYVGLYLLQVIRIRREEQCLAADPAYARYCNRVRWRLLPGLY